ncbi:MAG: DUF424 family protein [Candidatus Bathyarchaeia archaeon]
MKSIYVNIIRRGGHVLVAACDADLLGKTLTDGGLEFYVSEKFYKGEKKSLEAAIEAIRHANSANLIGRDIVEKAVSEGLVHPKAILAISGIPHAQIIRI